MARTKHRLTANAVENLKKPGLYADGGNLHLRVAGFTDTRLRWFCDAGGVLWVGVSSRERSRLRLCVVLDIQLITENPALRAVT